MIPKQSKTADSPAKKGNGSQNLYKRKEENESGERSLYKRKGRVALIRVKTAGCICKSKKGGKFW